MLHSSLIPCLLILSLPLLESSHRYSSQNKRYQVVPEPQAHRYHHQVEGCPPKLTKSCTTSTVPSTEKIKKVECQPAPPKKVCKKEPQPDLGCQDVPQPPDQECLDRVEEICQDTAVELCKVDPIETCKTEVRLLCDIEVETSCRLIEGSSPEGSDKCADLRAQGIDCHPVVDPVQSADRDGGVVELWETCEEVPLTRSSCAAENCQEVAVNELKCRQVSSIECQALWDRNGDCHYVQGGDGEVEVWETCEDVAMTRSSCTGEVCHDVPVTGRQCDALDLENCREVAVKELKCRQVSGIECQALWDRGGDCHYVQGQDQENKQSGGLQAFEICEDYPGGEVCQEQEVEVCQLSNGVEDKLCPEVEVNKCRADMVGECTPEPICKPLPALPLVETCEEVPGVDICEDIWTTEETTKRERTCEQKLLCCGAPCPAGERQESILLEKIKPWKESSLKKIDPWQKRHGGLHSSRYSKAA